MRASADAAPDAVAVESPGFRLTYRALLERSTRLARALRRRGVRRERRVALCFARTHALADLVTALLGVLEAGGAFLVLDPQDPPARQERILAAAQPSLLIGDGGLDGLAPRWGVRLTPQRIALADAPEQSPASARDEGAEQWMPSDLVYLAFTSGSTGEPKGVAVEHGAIAGYLDAACHAFGLGPGDRLLQIGSPAFDLAYEQIFVTLGSGATLVGLPTHELPSTRDLLEQCDHRGITALDLPTALFERMARDAAQLELRLPPALRLVVIGGENANVWSAEAWYAAARAPLRLLNTYGPTEATIVATWREFKHAEELGGSGPSLPIGRAVAGVETLLLDDERRPVTAGSSGELWLGGPGLARGYHRRPSLTAERFLALDCAGGRRFYRTGDRVRRLANGDLEFLGRVDRQVKIRGRRVEPGEVEAVLRSIPLVRDVATTVDTRHGRARLRAWVVLGAGAADLDVVRAETARQLPPHMLPAFEVVAALPRSGSGKVDLSALDDTGPAPPSDPPRDGIETRIAAIWRMLLGGPTPSRHADFFALGADSLAAVGLLAAIEHDLGHRFEMSALLEASSIAGIAARLSRPLRFANPGESPTCLVPLQARGERPPLYCAHGLGGHLLRLLPLAAALAPDQPFVGLQSPGLDDAEQVPSTIEALAARFLAEIRAVDDGPTLHLTGMSFGGIVAFEIARQATAAGLEVALVAMFDTDLGEVLPGFRPSAPGFRARLADCLRRFGGDAIGHARRRLRQLRNAGDPIRKANEYRHFTRVLRLNDSSLRRYLPGTYRGPVTFLAATERDPALYLAFEELTGCALEHVPASGGHLGMLEPPHVEGLAQELRRRVGDSAHRASSTTAPPLRGARA